jgi:hypothetical protein
MVPVNLVSLHLHRHLEIPTGLMLDRRVRQFAMELLDRRLVILISAGPFCYLGLAKRWVAEECAVIRPWAWSQFILMKVECTRCSAKREQKWLPSAWTSASTSN